MSSMDIDDAKANEAHAVHDMTPGHMDAHNLHMHMTPMRPQTPGDAARANDIVTQLRSGIEKYKDYHVALNDGYKSFCRIFRSPNITSRITGRGSRGFLFRSRAPTSLLYRKTSDGYELVGAMYTCQSAATQDQLNPASLSALPRAFAHQPMHAAEGTIPEHELD